jgi:hypothetical protein
MFIKKNVMRRFFIKFSNKNVFATFLLNLQKKHCENVFFIKSSNKKHFATFIKKNIAKTFFFKSNI